MPINTRRFQESITRELEIIKNGIRDLIGDRHWGEEGRFKEAVQDSSKRIREDILKIVETVQDEFRKLFGVV